MTGVPGNGWEVAYVPPPAGTMEPEFLVLDIGDDVGALIVYTTEPYLGRELDLTPSGQPRSHHMHSMVRRRRAMAREFVAAVYPELPEGDYTLWNVDGTANGLVTIHGGEVTEHQAGDCGRLPD